MPSYKTCHKSIIFIGAGNVATHLSQTMKSAGFSIRQVFSRTADSAKHLANICGCAFTTDIKKVMPDADIYIFSLQDDILKKVLTDMPVNNGQPNDKAENYNLAINGTVNNGSTGNGLWIHTAGSIHIDIFRGYTYRYGVIYPMQTLSKSRKTDFSKIPLFVEGCTDSIENEIYNIAKSLSDNVIRMTSEKRKYLHLAAVFACNFSNHMYTIAAKILEKQGINRHILQPLIDETANKLYSMDPESAQTGPAVRYDCDVIERHLSMLDDENLRNLYKMISESIAKVELLSEK